MNISVERFFTLYELSRALASIFVLSQSSLERACSCCSVILHKLCEECIHALLLFFSYCLCGFASSKSLSHMGHVTLSILALASASSGVLLVHVYCFGLHISLVFSLTLYSLATVIPLRWNTPCLRIPPCLLACSFCTTFILYILFVC